MFIVENVGLKTLFLICWLTVSNLERKISEILSALGFDIKPWDGYEYPANTIITQFPVSNFKLDFACPSSKIAIEVDGSYWHRSATQKVKDLLKTSELTKNGWLVLRLPERVLSDVHLKDRINCWLNTLDY